LKRKQTQTKEVRTKRQGKIIKSSKLTGAVLYLLPSAEATEQPEFFKLSRFNTATL
jgi:hypothetical protein